MRDLVWWVQAEAVAKAPGRSTQVEWRSSRDIPARQRASEVGTASTAPPAERREGFAANAARVNDVSRAALGDPGGSWYG